MDLHSTGMILVPVGEPPPSRGSTGHARRLAANVLPKPFFLLNKDTSMLVGGFIVACCFQVATAREVVFNISAFATYEPSIPVQSQDFAYRSRFSKFRPDFERRARDSNVTASGTLNHHFSDMARDNWRVWPLTGVECADILQCYANGTSMRITSPASFTTSLGVQPTVVEQLPDFDAQVAEAAASAFPDAEPDLSLGAIVATDSSTGLQDVSRNISAMSHAVSGNTGHRFDAESMLSCIKLASHLKPKSRLCDVLADAVDILYRDQPHEQLHNDLVNGSFKLPSENSLRMARVKLDVLHTAFEMELALTHWCRRYLSYDSSPIFGHNFYVVREERIIIPMDVAMSLTADMDLSAYYEDRIMQLSTLGHGNANSTKKGLNTAGLYLNESKDDDQFHVRRDEVRNTLSDQGTEKALGDDMVTIIERFKDFDPANITSLFMYPKSLNLPGHLHILYNALKEAFGELKSTDSFICRLRDIERFLSDKGLRTAFMEKCMQDVSKRHLFVNYSTTHIDWRWEFLGKVLSQLIPLLEHLKGGFNESVLLSSASGDKISNATVSACGDALRKEDGFECRCELFRVIGGVLETYAHKLESCHCHEDIWVQKISMKRRREVLKKLTGHMKCVWKGKRGPWWVCIGRKLLYAELAKCTSDRLDAMLARLPEDIRLDILTDAQALRLRLIEVLGSKLEFWDHIPWKALGIFWCMVGGDVDVCKQLCRECFAEYDAAIAAGKPVHRVAVLLFDKTSPCRAELEMWLNFTLPLSQYRIAYMTLLEYALCSLVERNIERIHSVIKRIGSSSPHILPPYLCARVREEQALHMLRTNQSFQTFAKSKWFSRTLLRDVLTLRYSLSKISNMTKLEKIKTIYNCTIECLHENVRPNTAARARALAITDTAWQRGALPKLPGSWTLTMAYLKGVFQYGDIFSMPTELFEAARLGLYDPADASDPIKFLLDAAGSQAVYDLDDVASTTFFMVVNTRPENRTYVDVPHLQRSRHTIAVVVYDVIAKRGERVCVCIPDGVEHVLFDLKVVVARLEDSYGQMFKWSSVHAKSAIKEVMQEGADGADRGIAAGAITDLPAQTGSSSSASIGPASSLQLVPFMNPQQMVITLASLLHDGRLLQGPVPFRLLDNISRSMLERAQQHGAVTLYTDEFNDLQVVLNMNCVAWTVLSHLGRPAPFSCVARRDLEPLQRAKLQNMLLLKMHGFKPTTGATPLRSTSPLECVYDTNLPNSYFAAMDCHDVIFAKGIPCIVHNAKDGYYRCLLKLPREKLADIIEEFTSDTHANQWYMNQLVRDDAVLDEAHVASDGEAEPPVAPIALRQPDLPPLVAPAIPNFEWKRCIASLEGTKCIIYFDNSTHDSGNQRGWVNCPAHGCIAYKFCHHFESRLEFAAYMCRWVQACILPECGSKATHLQYSPAAHDIQLAKSQLVIDDF